MYIQHRRLGQPKSGRRILAIRRSHDEHHDPDRRTGQERRTVSDRRKTVH